MDVGMAFAPPVDELDAELERALGHPHELVLVEVQQLVILLDGGDGRFADADCTDGVGLQDFDVVEALEQVGEQRCRHPAG
jgi:hypothetical protein